MSLESLKGTWVELGSARALMHIPKAVSDRLMLLASEALRPAMPQGCCSKTTLSLLLSHWGSIRNSVLGLAPVLRMFSYT